MDQTYPERAHAAIQSVWTWLELSFHPLAPWVVSIAIVFGVQWAIRKWMPSAWQVVADLGPAGKKASKAWQALPSVMLGAIVVSLGTGADLKLTVIGALTALAAPLGHELLRWGTSKMPGPTYVGGSWPAAGSASIEDVLKTNLRKSGKVLLLLAVSLSLVCCSSIPEPCSPDGVKAARQAAGCAVLAAGKCDDEALDSCPALADAETAHQLHVTACAIAGQR